jgi:hypothetical protein
MIFVKKNYQSNISNKCRKYIDIGQYFGNYGNYYKKIHIQFILGK